MDLYRLNGSRNNFVKYLKFINNWNERKLTSTERIILIKEETLKLKKQFFDKYQLGDPQEIEDLYQELCMWIDIAIEDYHENAKAAR